MNDIERTAKAAKVKKRKGTIIDGNVCYGRGKTLKYNAYYCLICKKLKLIQIPKGTYNFSCMECREWYSVEWYRNRPYIRFNGMNNNQTEINAIYKLFEEKEIENVTFYECKERPTDKSANEIVFDKEWHAFCKVNR